MTKDTIFKEVKEATDFKFGADVVKVFDNMVGRSVPFYDEIQRMTAEIAGDFAVPGTRIYDLGCSTGRTLAEMNLTTDSSVEFVGLDDSPEMLGKCASRLSELGMSRSYQLVTANLAEDFEMSNASVAVLCLTLQFIRPICRVNILRKIAEKLNPGGALILVEKVLAEENSFNRDFIKYYYEMKKRNAYSEVEIAQKREALENVLIPYKLSENILVLKEAGFQTCEIFFKWYNFAGIVAVKNQ